MELASAEYRSTPRALSDGAANSGVAVNGPTCAGAAAEQPERAPSGHRGAGRRTETRPRELPDARLQHENRCDQRDRRDQTYEPPPPERRPAGRAHALSNGAPGVRPAPLPVLCQPAGVDDIVAGQRLERNMRVVALAMNLTARGYPVTEAETGTKALTALADRPHDAVVLDLGLPDISGLDVIRAVREDTSTPIIVLSARSGSTDKVTALDLGADDYVTKPFSVDELLARPRATARPAAAADEQVAARVGDVQIDLGLTSAVDSSGAPVHLTPTEWRILDVVLRPAGKACQQRLVVDRGARLVGAHRPQLPADLHGRSCAAKLEPSRPRHLITEPGMGYRYRP